MLIAFCCLRMAWKCLGRFHSREEKAKKFSFCWEDWTKGRCPRAPLRRLWCHWLPHSPPSSVLHLSLPLYNRISRDHISCRVLKAGEDQFVTTLARPPERYAAWEAGSGSDRPGTVPCTGGDLQLLSPSDASSGAMQSWQLLISRYYKLLFLHRSLYGLFGVPQAEPPPPPPPRAASLRWSWQRDAGSQRAAFQNPLLLTGPRSGTYSIFTTQWYAANIFLPRRQKHVSSSYSLSLWKISVVCKETLSVCLYVCVFEGAKK